MAKPYNVSDGKMLLTLQPVAEGGYLVTSPLDPELVTQAETVEEAFVMAKDLASLLKKVRADWAKDIVRIQKARSAVPRHREIKRPMALVICRQHQIAPPPFK